MTGAKLKLILFNAGVSQRKVAEFLGIPQQTFSYNLTCDDVKSSIVEKVAEYLNVPVGSLYDEMSATTINNQITKAVDSTIAVGAGASASSNANNDLMLRLVDELAATRAQNDKLIQALTNNNK